MVGITTIAVAFLVMLVIMLMGIPIASVMLIMGVIGGVLAFGWPLVDSTGPVMWSVMNDNLLTAIPLFILLGELMLRSGMADKMYGATALWLNRLPGGLLHTNIGCCAMFAATSGSSVATAATIGTVATPSLNERGYDKAQSLGSIAAGGTLGILIPPSVNLLIYGSLAETSIGQLFVAGIVPGLLLVVFFMLWIVIRNWNDTSTQIEEVPLAEKLRASTAMIPPAIIFLVVMGSIYLGIATPTESAALGVVTALIIVGFGGHLSAEFFGRCFIQTARTTGMVLLIVLAAFILNVTLSLTGVAQTTTNWVTSLGLSATELLLVLIVFYVLLGMFMDVLSMMVLTIPIAVPVVTSMGVDPVWFGIFIIIMCELGMITPPVGMNLYVVHGVRQDDGPFTDLIRGAFPYVIIMILFVLLLIWLPGIATWLPRTMYG
ncbi:MAG: TRAP transporter large permease [Rhodobacteraceae bacterium]|uniref:TRAP transporter large permease n=1 Tax=Amaricoccus sp. TaxID=1872485 RepID=UPI001DABD323|nr:TRAP transporter large permease [Amaricoccus sp.]MCB1374077.1 TRAP transporter large permease [Paracoccaceae bacterium]MCB1401713.1 TRAP transporter large permease [Paracoccaceae bacterium]HRW15197.1 TRAP transporter large permease [Amaricoccus sp.]